MLGVSIRDRISNKEIRRRTRTKYALGRITTLTRIVSEPRLTTNQKDRRLEMSQQQLEATRTDPIQMERAKGVLCTAVDACGLKMMDDDLSRKLSLV